MLHSTTFHQRYIPPTTYQELNRTYDCPTAPPVVGLCITITVHNQKASCEHHEDYEILTVQSNNFKSVWFFRRICKLSCQTEIANAQNTLVGVQQIAGFQITMQISFGMHVVNRTEELIHKLLYLYGKEDKAVKCCLVRVKTNAAVYSLPLPLKTTGDCCAYRHVNRFRSTP